MSIRHREDSEQTIRVFPDSHFLGFVHHQRREDRVVKIQPDRVAQNGPDQALFFALLIFCTRSFLKNGLDFIGAWEAVDKMRCPSGQPALENPRKKINNYTETDGNFPK